MPLIAVFGSTEDGRVYDPPLRGATREVVQACEDIGRELANNGCRLLTYSSNPKFVEASVVRGYLSVSNALRCIQLRAPVEKSNAHFTDYPGYPNAFEFRPDTSPDWQVAFYRSLFEADGVLLVGGGRSTFVAGLITLALEIPVVALAVFGGESQRVWDALDRVRNDATSDDLLAMAGNWGPESAARNVEGLLRQIRARHDRNQRAQRARVSHQKSARRSLTVATLFLLLGLAIIPLMFIIQPGAAGNVAAMIATPLLVAPCGAIIRNILDGSDQWWPTAVLGMVAGTMSGLLFVLAQLAASPDLLNGEPARRLLLFLAVVGFVAGLTFDTVYKGLRTRDILDTSALTNARKIP